MTDLDKTIRYVFDISCDPSDVERSSRVVEDNTNAQEHNIAVQAQVRQESQATNQTLQSQQVTLMTQLTALMGFKEATANVIGGVTALGLVSDEAAQDLMKINAAFNLFAGAVTALKSVQAVMTTLNTASAIGASIDAFRVTLQRPAMAATVGIAAGAAMGVAGAFLLSGSSTTNNTTTITVQDTTPSSAVNEIYQIVSGGTL